MLVNFPMLLVDSTVSMDQDEPPSTNVAYFKEDPVVR